MLLFITIGIELPKPLPLTSKFPSGQFARPTTPFSDVDKKFIEESRAEDDEEEEENGRAARLEPSSISSKEVAVLASTETVRILEDDNEEEILVLLLPSCPFKLLVSSSSVSGISVISQTFTSEPSLVTFNTVGRESVWRGEERTG